MYTLVCGNKLSNNTSLCLDTCQLRAIIYFGVVCFIFKPVGRPIMFNDFAISAGWACIIATWFDNFANKKQTRMHINTSWISIDAEILQKCMRAQFIPIGL